VKSKFEEWIIEYGFRNVGNDPKDSCVGCDSVRAILFSNQPEPTSKKSEIYTKQLEKLQASVYCSKCIMRLWPDPNRETK